MKISPAAAFGVHRRCRITPSSRRRPHRTGPAIVIALAVTALAPGAASAQTVGVTVGAGQSVTNTQNLTSNIGIEFTSDGGTFTNAAGATITATPSNYPNCITFANCVFGKIFSGPNVSALNTPYNNLTVNNYGTLQYLSNSGSGAYFAGNPILNGNTQTGQTTVSGITINNYATGVITGLDADPFHDDVPLSFEGGVSGAIVNNQGTISTAGTSIAAAGIRVGTGPYATSNVTINNQVGGMIKNTADGQAILLTPGSVFTTSVTGPVSNVTIDNGGTISGGTANSNAGAVAITGDNGLYGSPAAVSVPGVQINNTGTIDGSGTVAINNLANTAAVSITNSGTIKGDILLGSGGDTVTATGGTIQGNITGQNSGETLTFNPGAGNTTSVTGAIGSVSTIDVASGTTALSQSPTGFSQLTLQGGTLVVTGGLTVSDATLGGTGTIDGNVTVSNGSTVHVGGSPDALTVNGDFSQTGGALTFEIDPDGSGGFLTSTLVVGPGHGVSLDGTTVAFDFVGGADPALFAADGLFDLDTFFRVTNGAGTDPLGSADLSFADVAFVADVGGAETGLQLNADGSFAAAVPEPGSLSLLGAALAGFGAVRRRRPSRKAKGDRAGMGAQTCHAGAGRAGARNA